MSDVNRNCQMLRCVHLATTTAAQTLQSAPAPARQVFSPLTVRNFLAWWYFGLSKNEGWTASRLSGNNAP